MQAAEDSACSGGDPPAKPPSGFCSRSRASTVLRRSLYDAKPDVLWRRPSRAVLGSGVGAAAQGAALAVGIQRPLGDVASQVEDRRLGVVPLEAADFLEQGRFTRQLLDLVLQAHSILRV